MNAENGNAQRSFLDSHNGRVIEKRRAAAHFAAYKFPKSKKVTLIITIGERVRGTKGIEARRCAVAAQTAGGTREKCLRRKVLREIQNLNPRMRKRA